VCVYICKKICREYWRGAQLWYATQPVGKPQHQKPQAPKNTISTYGFTLT
jgi:hypothetical protein